MSRADAPRLRVLVIDDAEGIRGYLANLLELEGYEVDTAEDGRSHWRCSEGGAAPDAILLDVMLPGIDGLGTLRRIRALDERVPVVMLSVVGKAGTIVQAMQPRGAADYLNKPFEEALLRATLESARAPLARAGARSAGTSNSFRSGGDGAATRYARCAPRSSRSPTTGRHDPDPGRSGVGKEIVARTAHDLVAAQGLAVHQGELRGAARRTARERAVRLREGEVHAQARQVRGRPPRHDLPRRDRGNEPRSRQSCSR